REGATLPEDPPPPLREVPAVSRRGGARGVGGRDRRGDAGACLLLGRGVGPLTEPLARFRRWFRAAARARIPLAEAMALATAGRRAREPPLARRALDWAAAAPPPAAGAAAAGVDGLPHRPRVGRVLDAPGAPPARARALRADAGGVEAAAPPALRRRWRERASSC